MLTRFKPGTSQVPVQRLTDIASLPGYPSRAEYSDYEVLGKFIQFYNDTPYFVVWHSKFAMK
jgi:hypothetical protein